MQTNNSYPIAFLSYARFNDEAEDGYVSKFRHRLSQEVEKYTGEPFQIFQDTKDIKWSENWKSKIEESLNEAFFLIAIITPSFFRSQACRQEIDLFRHREKALGRTDLIFPVYFIDCPILHEERTRESDSIVRLIHSRQWEDWRQLRLEDWESTEVRKAFPRLAVRLRDAIATTVEMIGPVGGDTLPEPAATRLLFPHLGHYKQGNNPTQDMTFMMVTGEGPSPLLPHVRFPGPGAVKRAETRLTALAVRAGLSDEQIMHITANRAFGNLEMRQKYVCAIASPAVNPYTRTLLDQIMGSTIGQDHIGFIADHYPDQSVHLSLDKWLVDKQEIARLPTDSYHSNGEKIVFLPRVSDDKLSGTDYGLLVRRVTKKGETPQLQLVLAGCKNYGTWAAYLAATETSLIQQILGRLGLAPADLESERSFWVLLEAVGRDGLLRLEDVSIVSCGVLTPSAHRLVPTPPTDNDVTGIEVLQHSVKKMGYLFCGTADIRNIYQNQENSSPYQVTFVYKEGFDSVAVLLYFLRDRHIYVGTIENLRPALYVRKLFSLPKRDEQEYLYFRGIIAGALEKLGGDGNGYINRRAAQEIMEESGFRADPEKIVDLGSYFVSPGYCVERMFLRAYELEDFAQERIRGDGTLYEDGIRIKFQEVREVLSFYASGTFEDPKTEIAIRRLCARLGYIPDIDTWHDELDKPLKQKYRSLFEKS